MNLTPKISVIVPVYKVEQYIHRCIDSILSQSFTDFELILVNDGSPDNCGKICDEYAQKDSRVRVFHKTNGGVSSARNLGLDNARGEWIAFLDSDDSFEINHLQNYIEVVEIDSDIVIMGRKIKDEEGSYRGELLPNDMDSKQYSNGMKGVVQELFPKFNLLYTVWNALYRKNILLKYNIHFNSNVSWGEDTLFSFQYLIRCNRIQTIAKSSYHYLKNYNNASNRYHPNMNNGIKMRIPLILLFLEQIGFSKEEIETWNYKQNYWRIKWSIGNLYRSSSPLIGKEKIKEISKILQDTPYRKIIKDCGQKKLHPLFSKIQETVIYIGSPTLIHITTNLMFTFLKLKQQYK